MRSSYGTREGGSSSRQIRQRFPSGPNEPFQRPVNHPFLSDLHMDFMRAWKKAYSYQESMEEAVFSPYPLISAF